jgi:hypothetical protein
MTLSPDDGELLAAALRTIRIERARIRTLRRGARARALSRLNVTTAGIAETLLHVIAREAARHPTSCVLSEEEFHISLALPWLTLKNIAHEGRAIRATELFKHATRRAREHAEGYAIEYSRAMTYVDHGGSHYVHITPDGLAWPIGLPEIVRRDLQAAHAESTLNPIAT